MRGTRIFFSRSQVASPGGFQLRIIKVIYSCSSACLDVDIQYEGVHSILALIPHVDDNGDLCWVDSQFTDGNGMIETTP